MTEKEEQKVFKEAFDKVYEKNGHEYYCDSEWGIETSTVWLLDEDDKVYSIKQDLDHCPYDNNIYACKCLTEEECKKKQKDLNMEIENLRKQLHVFDEYFAIKYPKFHLV